MEISRFVYGIAKGSLIWFGVYSIFTGYIIAGLSILVVYGIVTEWIDSLPEPSEIQPKTNKEKRK